MSDEKIHSYKDLIVWQKSMNLVTNVYQLTNVFPKTEMYGLTSQMRRAAVSIPSNIAEGRRRDSKKQYRRFLNDAYGSGAELETQIEIAKILNYAKTTDYQVSEQILNEIMRMLNKMISSLSAPEDRQDCRF